MGTRPAILNRSRTLEQLEAQVWPSSELDTHLVLECHRLRKVPLKEFSVENLRIMIGQAIGVQHLLPIALEVLESNPWAEGDYYPGDLLYAVVGVDPAFWAQNEQLRIRLDEVITNLKGELETRRDLFENKVLPAWQKIYGDG